MSLQPMLLTLALGPVAVLTPPPAALEFSGRGYARVSAGTFGQAGIDPTLWRNELPIHWPQPPVDWGPATYLLLLRASDGVALANALIQPAGYFVAAGEQPRIAPGNLQVYGVGPNTDRPYGVGTYSFSVYGRYPPEGAIFSAQAVLEFAWTHEDNRCRAWSPAAPVLTGGCA